MSHHRVFQALSRPLAQGALLLGVAVASNAFAQTERDGVVVIAMQSEPPTLVSAFNPAGFSGVVSTKVLEGLLSYDYDLNPKPALAESWTVSDDGKTYQFNLRQNVKWHDGEPFTSADVAYTLEEVWKKLHPRGRATFGGVTKVLTPDAHTVIMELDTPAPPMLSALSSYSAQILPAHLYKGTDVLANPLNNAPIGTGPFKFDEWQRGSFTRYVANEEYWDSGKPYVDELVFRYIADAGSRSAALETGEAHLATFNAVTLSDVKRLSDSGKITVETKGYEYLSPIFLLELNQRGPYLSNVKVRQALAHAINRDFIVDTVWYGYGKVATGPIPSTHKSLYSGETTQYAYDPEQANKLLDEAGFPRKDNGSRFGLSIDFSPYADTVPRTAEYIKQALRRVGIDLTLRSQDIPTMLRRVFTEYDYGMHMNFYYALPDPVLGVQRLYWGKNIKKGVPFANAHGYNNPEMDALLEAAQVENDAAKRKALYAEMQEIAQRDMPVLDLFEMQFVTLAAPNLQGHTTGSEGPYGTWAELRFEK